MKRTLITLCLAQITLVANAAPILLNTSFEENNVPNVAAFGSFKYAGVVSATGWSFTGGSGVAREGSGFNGDTPYGNYYGFLQNTSSISQTFTSDGDYWLDLSFYLVDRTGYGLNQLVSVTLNGNTLFSQINASTTWTEYVSSPIQIGAGSHTLTFSGTANLHDNTTYLDNISMTARAIPPSNNVPEPATLGLLGLGLLGLGAARLRKA